MVLVSAETATSATRDLTQRRSLSPGLCRSHEEITHPPAVLPSQSPALLLGHKERISREETAICEVTGAVKPETEE